MISEVVKWGEFVKLSHTVFALPFAIASMVVAARDTRGWPGWKLFLLIVGAVLTGAVAVLDVRTDAEWNAGHIPGAVHVPLGRLPERLASLPRTVPLVVHCQGGTRSAIAASLLRAQGFDDVTNLAGGFAGWVRAGKLVEREEPEPAAT